MSRKKALSNTNKTKLINKLKVQFLPRIKNIIQKYFVFNYIRHQIKFVIYQKIDIKYCSSFLLRLACKLHTFYVNMINTEMLN